MDYPEVNYPELPDIQLPKLPVLSPLVATEKPLASESEEVGSRPEYKLPDLPEVALPELSLLPPPTQIGQLDIRRALATDISLADLPSPQKLNPLPEFNPTPHSLPTTTRKIRPSDLPLAKGSGQLTWPDLPSLSPLSYSPPPLPPIITGNSPIAQGQESLPGREPSFPRQVQLPAVREWPESLREIPSEPQSPFQATGGLPRNPERPGSVIKGTSQPKASESLSEWPGLPELPAPGEWSPRALPGLPGTSSPLLPSLGSPEGQAPMWPERKALKEVSGRDLPKLSQANGSLASLPPLEHLPALGAFSSPSPHLPEPAGVQWPVPQTPRGQSPGSFPEAEEPGGVLGILGRIAQGIEMLSRGRVSGRDLKSQPVDGPILWKSDVKFPTSPTASSASPSFPWSR